MQAALQINRQPKQQVINETFIPSAYGSVEESFPANFSGKTVFYIQDAHDSLEAQENISKIIAHLVAKQGIKTVYEEGYEGPVPSDAYFEIIKNPVLREKTAHFLLDKLRIGGAEYAHINRKQDFRLIGIDSLKLHQENVRWYRQNARRQLETEKDLAAILSRLEQLANQEFPNELKTWMKMKDKVEAGKLQFSDYLLRLVPIEKLKNLEPRQIFEEIDRVETARAADFLKSEKSRKIFEYLKDIKLLKRLNRIEVTAEEYAALQARIHDLKTAQIALFIAKNSHKDVILSKQWEKNILAAIRFYETAGLRDRAVEKNLDAFVASPEKNAVLVFGGFHKEPLLRAMRQKGIGVVVMNPKISSVDEVHQGYYKRLMSRGYYDYEAALLAPQASRPEDIYQEVPLSRFRDYLLHTELGPQLRNALRTEQPENLQLRQASEARTSANRVLLEAELKKLGLLESVQAQTTAQTVAEGPAISSIAMRYMSKNESDFYPSWFTGDMGAMADMQEEGAAIFSQSYAKLLLFLADHWAWLQGRWMRLPQEFRASANLISQMMQEQNLSSEEASFLVNVIATLKAHTTIGAGMRRLRRSNETGFTKNIIALPDGRLVMLRHDHTAWIWNQEADRVERVLGQYMNRNPGEGHTAALNSALYLPGDRLATVSDDHTARIWDVKTGHLIHTLTGHTAPVYRAILLPGERLLTVSGDHTARIWNINTGKELRPLGVSQNDDPQNGHTGAVNDAVYLPKGRVATFSTDGTIRIWNIETGKGISTLGNEKTHKVLLNGALFRGLLLPDRRLLALARNENARLWNVETETESPRLGHILQIQSGSFLTISYGMPANDAVLLPSGRLFTVHIDTTGRIWDPETASQLQQFGEPRNTTPSIGHSHGGVLTGLFLPNGYLLTTGIDKTARIWDPQTGRMPLVMGNLLIQPEDNGHQTAIGQAVVLPNGRLATLDWDGEVYISSLSLSFDRSESRSNVAAPQQPTVTFFQGEENLLFARLENDMASAGNPLLSIADGRKGAGKTTFARAFVTYLAARGKETALVEGDWFHKPLSGWPRLLRLLKGIFWQFLALIGVADEQRFGEFILSEYLDTDRLQAFFNRVDEARTHKEPTEIVIRDGIHGGEKRVSIGAETHIIFEGILSSWLLQDYTGPKKVLVTPSRKLANEMFWKREAGRSKALFLKFLEVFDALTSFHELVIRHIRFDYRYFPVRPSVRYSDWVFVQLSGGQGTRMGAEVPKPLVRLLGRPLMEYSLEDARRNGVPAIVVGSGNPLVEEASKNISEHYVVSKKGYDEAYFAATSKLGNFRGDILMSGGDTVPAGPEVVAELMEAHKERRGWLPSLYTFATVKVSHPQGHPRIVRLADGRFENTVSQEEIDWLRENQQSLRLSDGTERTGDELNAIDEIWPAFFALNGMAYRIRARLYKISGEFKHPRQREERPFRFSPEKIARRGAQRRRLLDLGLIRLHELSTRDAVLNINTPQQLEQAAHLMAHRAEARQAQGDLPVPESPDSGRAEARQNGPSFAEIRQLLKHNYDIEAEESEMHTLSGGVQSRLKGFLPVYVRDKKGHEYVFRKGVSTLDRLRYQVEFATHLYRKGVPYPRIYDRLRETWGDEIQVKADRAILLYQGGHYTLEDFNRLGAHIRKREAEEKHYVGLGAIAARINNATADFRPETHYMWKERREIGLQIEKNFPGKFTQVRQELGDKQKVDAASLNPAEIYFLQHEKELEGLLQKQLGLFLSRYTEDLRRQFPDTHEENSPRNSHLHVDLDFPNTFLDEDGKVVSVIDAMAQEDHRIVEFINVGLWGNRPFELWRLIAALKGYQQTADLKLNRAEILGIWENLRLRLVEDVWKSLFSNSPMSALKNPGEYFDYFTHAVESLRNFSEEPPFSIDAILATGKSEARSEAASAPVETLFTQAAAGEVRGYGKADQRSRMALSRALIDRWISPADFEDYDRAMFMSQESVRQRLRTMKLSLPGLRQGNLSEVLSNILYPDGEGLDQSVPEALADALLDFVFFYKLNPPIDQMVPLHLYIQTVSYFIHYLQVSEPLRRFIRENLPARLEENPQSLNLLFEIWLGTAKLIEKQETLLRNLEKNKSDNQAGLLKATRLFHERLLQGMPLWEIVSPQWYKQMEVESYSPLSEEDRGKIPPFSFHRDPRLQDVLQVMDRAGVKALGYVTAADIGKAGMKIEDFITTARAIKNLGAVRIHNTAGLLTDFVYVYDEARLRRLFEQKHPALNRTYGELLQDAGLPLDPAGFIVALDTFWFYSEPVRSIIGKAYDNPDFAHLPGVSQGSSEARKAGPSLEEIPELLRREYGIEVENVRQLTGGSESLMHGFPPVYIRAADKKEYVFRKELPGIERARNNVSFMNHLHSKGLPVPHVYARITAPEEEPASLKAILKFEDGFFALEDFMAAGVEVPKREAEVRHYRGLGAFAAEVNNALRDYVPEFNRPARKGREIELESDLSVMGGLAEVFAKESQVRALNGGESYFLENATRIQEIFSRQLGFLQARYTEALRAGFADAAKVSAIHKDLHFRNVKFDESGKVVSAFDSDMRQDYRIMEFINIFLAHVTVIDPVVIEAALTGFQEKAEIKLTREEILGVWELLRLRLLENISRRLFSEDFRNVFTNPKAQLPRLAEAVDTLDHFSEEPPFDVEAVLQAGKSEARMGKPVPGFIRIREPLEKHGEIVPLIEKWKTENPGKRLLIFNADAHHDEYPSPDISANWARTTRGAQVEVVHLASYYADDVRQPLEGNWRTPARRYRIFKKIRDFIAQHGPVDEIWLSLDYDFFSLRQEFGQANREPVFHLDEEARRREMQDILSFFDDLGVEVARLVPAISADYLNVPEKEKPDFIRALTREVVGVFRIARPNQKQPSQALSLEMIQAKIDLLSGPSHAAAQKLKRETEDKIFKITEYAELVKREVPEGVQEKMLEDIHFLSRLDAEWDVFSDFENPEYRSAGTLLKRMINSLMIAQENALPGDFPAQWAEVKNAMNDFNQYAGEFKALSFAGRSELRRAGGKAVLLIDTDDLVAMPARQKKALFATLYMHRSELRLIAYNWKAQVRESDRGAKAILRLAQTTGETNPVAAKKQTGAAGSRSVLLLKPGRKFRPSSELKAAVLLKNQPGVFEYAREVALREKRGIFNPSVKILARIFRERLAHLVVAYAA